MSQESSTDLLNGKPATTLKSMTIPVIFGMIAMMTFNLVDTLFISMLGTEPLAAVSFTFPVTFSVISLSIGLGIGTSAVIARLIGQKKTQEARLYSTAALYLAIVMVGLVSLFGWLHSQAIFTLLGASHKTYLLIMQYMDIWFLGSVLLILPMICNAIFRANGETRVPSLAMAGAGLVNVMLDPLLIFGIGPLPAMGVKGAALASILSWTVGSLFVLYVLGIKHNRIDFIIRNYKAVAQAWRDIGRIGFPAAGASMLAPVSMAVMTAMIAHYGEHAVAAFGVGSRIESISCIVVASLSMTLAPFISQNYGAGQLKRVKQAYAVAIRFVLIWQLAVYLILAVSAWHIATLFSDSDAVTHIIRQFIWLLPLSYGAQGVAVLSNSAFNALHKPSAAVLLSVVRFFVLYIPLSFVGGYIGGLTGVFVGGVLGNLLAGLVAWYWFNQSVCCPMRQEVEVSV